MPIMTPLELRSGLQPGQRLLGLDVGSKTVGLALSDPTQTVATPPADPAPDQVHPRR